MRLPPLSHLYKDRSPRNILKTIPLNPTWLNPNVSDVI